MKNAQMINFPTHNKNSCKKNKIKNVDGIKYFNRAQIRLLRRTVRDQAELHEQKGNITSIREWMAIDLITTTGMRVSEAANLRCGDVKTGYAESEIFIRNGKGSRSRTIQIPESLKKHIKQFMQWKEKRKEKIGENDYVFVGQRGAWTSQAIQQIVKKYLKSLGLYESGKSAHALRHSYAVELYSKERDLRAVQKQLGHASIQTTQVYADVTKEDIQGQIRSIWN